MDRTDEELVLEYRNGEEGAFERLVDRHLSSVYAFILRLTSSDDAEDLTQETFLKAWKKLGQFDTKKHFKAWLFTIARNTVIDWYRMKKNVPFSMLDTDAGTFEETLTDTDPLPDELFADKENREQLEKALETLSPQERSIILLHDMNDLTFEEIATFEKKPMNTVKSIYRRALLKLRDRIG